MDTHEIIAPEVLVPRIGDMLVEQGFLQPDSLMEALKIQQKMKEEGKPALVGQILIELGLIDRPTLDQVVTEQILSLQEALRDANANLEQRVILRTNELQEALRKLSVLGELKLNFVANISHELRTPLTHLKGYAELFLSGALGDLDQEQLHAMRIIQRASDHLEQLIDNLILFSMAERGLIVLNKIPFDVSELSWEVANQYRPIGKDRDISIELQVQDDLPMITADRAKILWTVQHFVDNAIKFSPNGSLIIIQTHLAGDKIEIAVKDSGIGIPPERIEEIFEPFHQLDGSSTRKQGGTGLGLSLAKKIIEAHGSAIEVQSIPNMGSRFSFQLAVHQPSPNSHV